jgi:hypothetical protein
VVLAAAGLFAGTALPSSTTGTQSARATAIMGEQALALEKADFSTLAGIKRYLSGVGVDPRSVVIQRGTKNYAGPNCPGAAWTCTSANNVVQVGAQNTFECVATSTPALPPPSVTPTNTPGLQECVIVQGAAKNVAKCIQKSKHGPFVRQRCSITQSGTFNEATIVQVAEQTSGDVQGVLQEAGILQNATASTNRLQVDQESKQLTETGTTQDQDAYQVVGGPFASSEPPVEPAAEQIAVGEGDNASQIVQKQIQRAKGGETQTQNDGTYGAGAPFARPADCNDDPLSPIRPNACVNLEQTALNGTNGGPSDHQGQGQLTQTIDQEATTTELGAFQRQGFSAFAGGADGRVHQLIDPTGTGTSQNQANQSETLKLSAPPHPDLEQIQFGGAGCCGFGSQVGGVGNSEQINQQKLLEAKGGTEQTATLVGTSSSPQGNCTINHSAETKSDENADQSTTSESESPCPALAVLTVCQNTEGGVGECQEAEVCGSAEAPDIEVDEGGNVTVSCDEENGGPTLAGVTEPLPLTPSPLDSRR